ncbi:transcriptional regulator, LysR family [Malaciobacter marinus]|uniref:LysR family transcriptional regulator n=1 Tax=Malaciobacter marinus TaxID=505249 RepID=A0A347TLV9_9BACT|nr:LysR substrate-binding domain-containing protein [Malaciobacter marinus]AXX87587.1 transcriptional regulator, LysR family [Malaciobacter marinus]PHO11307.1 LysR family transcriptional regulator [Malaciobacter marinus]PHO14448.1 LysR family transcriptional regulator [Malaciobacter marinus]
MFTLKELDIFFKLCENSHISNLAKQVNLTQSAISISLNSLEKKIGENLFDRVGKKLVLNERGRFFKNKAIKPYLELKNLKDSFSDDLLKGELKIASSKTFNSINLSSYIFDFISNHEVSITKYSQNTKEIIDEVLDSTIDLGFIEKEFDDSNIIKERIASDSLIIVTSDETLSKKEYYIDQLYSKKWILREKGSGTREVFLSKLKYLDEFKITMEISNFEEIKDILLQHKDTLTCISKLAVKKELEKKQLFEIKTKNLKFDRELYMIYHKNKYKSKLFLEFTSYIKKCFKKF